MGMGGAHAQSLDFLGLRGQKEEVVYAEQPWVWQENGIQPGSGGGRQRLDQASLVYRARSRSGSNATEKSCSVDGEGKDRI